MKQIIAIQFLILLFCLACNRLNQLPIEENQLSGRWTELADDSNLYYSGTIHSFYFKDDSFTAKIISWADVIDSIPGNPCPSEEEVKTFIRGIYTLANDSIYFTGKLCDSLYSQEQPACDGTAKFVRNYKFIKTDTTIILNEDKPSSFRLGIVLRKE